MFGTFKTLMGAGGAYYADIIGSYDCGTNGSVDMLTDTMGTPSLNTKIFAVSMWVYKETSGTLERFVQTDTSDSTSPLEIRHGSGGALEIDVRTIVGRHRLLGSGTPFDAGSVNTWKHIYVVYDSTQVVDTNRVRAWVDGSQQTLTPSGADVFPLLNGDNLWANTTGIGREFSIGGAGTVGNGMNGLFTQFAFFNGSYPTISQVYNNGPKVLGGITDLAYYLIGRSGSDFADEIFATDWTNSSSAVILDTTNRPSS